MTYSNNPLTVGEMRDIRATLSAALELIKPGTVSRRHSDLRDDMEDALYRLSDAIEHERALA